MNREGNGWAGWQRGLAWVALSYVVLAFGVGSIEAIAFILGFHSRENFMFLPQVITPLWGARQMLSVGLAVGLSGYLAGSAGLARVAGAFAGLIASLQAFAAVADWTRGITSIPLSAMLYAFLAATLEREAATLRINRKHSRA
jgi:hypothetical protein